MSDQLLWFATRGAGIVSLLMLTGVVVLGILNVSRWQAPSWPRFLTAGLHRNLSLLALVFLAVHIVTAIVDPFTALGPAAALIPFASSYRPLWVGLGVIAFDLLVALIVTSLIRARLGQRTWRAVHWLAYGAWPLAITHGIGAGSDAFALWMLGLDVLCAGLVGVAVVWRVATVRAGSPEVLRQVVAEVGRPETGHRARWPDVPMNGSAPLARLLAGPPLAAGAESFADHKARLGRLPAVDGASLIATLEASGLSGRGGAGFPVGRKWRTVAQAAGDWPVVLVNGAEGEPLSAKDRALMVTRPHLVLDGALVAAAAVGADQIVLYVGEAHTAARAALGRAVLERGPQVSQHFRLVAAPARYVAGEESAAVHYIDTGDARPTSVPPRPYERGIGGRPTLVQNVESLAHVALIARHGDGWYRGAGSQCGARHGPREHQRARWADDRPRDRVRGDDRLRGRTTRDDGG